MQLSKIGDSLPGAVRPLVRRSLVRYRFRGLRPTDAVLVSYPKSGSTWLRFLMAQAMTGHEADYDAIRDTMPPVGRHRQAPPLLPTGGRVARTHEPMRPWRGRPGQPVIYLVRDGRDVCISYFNHVRRQGDAWELPAFAEAFLTGGIDGYGPWHEHVLAGLEARRSTSSVMVLRYEDLRADPVLHLGEVLGFLGAEVDGRDLAGVVAANQAERMRAKEATSAFLRTRAGSADGGSAESRPWAEALAPDLRRRFEQVCGPALEAAGYGLSGVDQPAVPTT